MYQGFIQVSVTIYSHKCNYGKLSDKFERIIVEGRLLLFHVIDNNLYYYHSFQQYKTYKHVYLYIYFNIQDPSSRNIKKYTMNNIN